MEIRDRIEKIAEQTIAEAGESISALCEKLNTTPEEVVRAWVVWDTSINEYDNSIYTSNAMRIAMHLHNNVRGSWHDKRQSKVIDLIKQITPSSIVEVGFGTPQRYVTEYVFENHISLTLLDFDDESLDFAKAFLDTKSDNWSEHISLRKYDMNSKEPIGEFDLYIFQDSIEHSNEPTSYLKSVVSTAKPNSHFIFCIPIEIDKAVPEHHIFWRNTNHALEWIVQQGLQVISHSEIEMNSELDLFAKFLHPDFKEVLILAQKV